jgi:hypothetical protein
VEAALAETRANNLMDDMRMSAKQRLEEFLLRAGPGLRHEAKQ